MNGIKPNSLEVYPRVLQCDSVPADSWCCGLQDVLDKVKLGAKMTTIGINSCAVGFVWTNHKAVHVSHTAFKPSCRLGETVCL